MWLFIFKVLEEGTLKMSLHISAVAELRVGFKRGFSPRTSAMETHQAGPAQHPFGLWAQWSVHDPQLPDLGQSQVLIHRKCSCPGSLHQELSPDNTGSLHTESVPCPGQCQSSIEEYSRQKSHSPTKANNAEKSKMAQWLEGQKGWISLCSSEWTAGVSQERGT